MWNNLQQITNGSKNRSNKAKGSVDKGKVVLIKKEDVLIKIRFVATLSTFSVFIKKSVVGFQKTLTCQGKRKWLHVGVWGVLWAIVILVWMIVAGYNCYLRVDDCGCGQLSFKCG